MNPCLKGKLGYFICLYAPFHYEHINFFTEMFAKFYQPVLNYQQKTQSGLKTKLRLHVEQTDHGAAFGHINSLKRNE